MMHLCFAPAPPRAIQRQRGVTLVEMLIGMLVGMLAVLVISQVLLTSEGQKRTTTGGADAQVNGALALYTLQRDVELAGYGIASSPTIIGCPISARFNGTTPTGFAATLAPVVITPQASRPTGSVGDSIRVLASSTNAVAVPTRVITPNYVAGGNTFNVRSTVGFSQGDLALVATDDANPCWVFQVNGAPTATSLPRTDNATWNAAGNPSVNYNDGAVMINLGTLVDNRYEINNETFGVTSFNVATPNSPVTRQLQTDIVQLRAFYGRDTSAGPGNDGIVDVFDTTTPTTNAAWQKLLSVRVIAVARSSTYEKDIVTTANPRWSVGTSPAVTGAATCPSGSGSCIELDVGAGVAGDVPAKHYRYKVFETVIPLRNMLWRSA
jgi:type IV pilus assembly protein PilW